LLYFRNELPFAFILQVIARIRIALSSILGGQVLRMEINHSNNLIALHSRADANIFEVLGEDVLSVPSVRNTIIDNQAENCLQSMVSPLHFEL
jgi:hypothetical protein